MKFACERCGRSYSVADELRGRAFKMKCKSCDHLIVVKPAAAPVVAVVPPPPAPAAPPAPALQMPPKWTQAANERAVAEVTPSVPERSSVASPPRLSADSVDPMAAKPAGPVPGVVAPSNGEYLDFALEPERIEEATPPSEEPPADEAVAAVLEAAMATPSPDTTPAGRDIGTGSRDPFGGLGPLESEPEIEVASEPLAPVSPEPVPKAAPVPPPVVSGPPESPASSPTASLMVKVRGLPKAAIYGGAAALVVVAGVLVLATRKGEPTATPTAAEQVAAPQAESPAAAGLRITMSKPELAAPDPQLAAKEAAAKGAAPLPPVPVEDGHGKHGATESGLQGRPIAPAPIAATPVAPAVAAPALEKQPAGKLESGQVARVVAANRSAFNACLAEAARRDPGLGRHGRTMVMVLTVSPSGSVASSTLTIDDVQLAESELGACLSSAAQRLVFPPFQGEPQQVRVPLAFSGAK